MKRKSIAEQLIDMVFAKLSPNIHMEIGERNKTRFVQAPAVVAVPLGAPSIPMTTRPGAEKVIDPQTNKPVMIRRLLLRQFNIEWHCHGAPDFVDAEDLYLDVLRVVRSCFHDSVQFSNEIWIDQQDLADGFERYGSVIAFTSTIDSPVWEQPQPTAIVNGAPPFITTGSILPTGD